MRLRSSLAALALLLFAHCAGQPVVETFTVSSDQEWPAATRRALEPGEAFIVEVAADQRWTSGSWTGTAAGDIPQWGDYSLPGATAYSLIGRITRDGRPGEPFFVGRRYEGVSAEGGILELGMNDVPGAYWDNRGALTVEVTIP